MTKNRKVPFYPTDNDTRLKNNNNNNSSKNNFFFIFWSDVAPPIFNLIYIFAFLSLFICLCFFLFLSLSLTFLHDPIFPAKIIIIKFRQIILLWISKKKVLNLSNIEFVHALTHSLTHLIRLSTTTTIRTTTRTI